MSADSEQHLATSNVLQTYDINKIGFIGFGNIVRPLVSGWLASGVVTANQIVGSCLSESTATRMRDKFGIDMYTNNSYIPEHCDVIVIAVKPHLVNKVLLEIAPTINPKKHLLFSLSACITLAAMQCQLPDSTKIIRVALNTCTEVQQTTCAYAKGTYVTDKECQLFECLMRRVGMCFCLDEKFLNLTSSISGCSVAYFCHFAESLADGALRNGMKKDIAIEMVAQTMVGAGKLILASKGIHPSQLKDDVCSPGGLTIQGLHMMEKSGVKGTIMDVVTETNARAYEIAKNFDNTNK